MKLIPVSRCQTIPYGSNSRMQLTQTSCKLTVSAVRNEQMLLEAFHKPFFWNSFLYAGQIVSWKLKASTHTANLRLKDIFIDNKINYVNDKNKAKISTVYCLCSLLSFHLPSVATLLLWSLSSSYNQFISSYMVYAFYCTVVPVSSCCSSHSSWSLFLFSFIAYSSNLKHL